MITHRDPTVIIMTQHKISVKCAITQRHIHKGHQGHSRPITITRYGSLSNKTWLRDRHNKLGGGLLRSATSIALDLVLLCNISDPGCGEMGCFCKHFEVVLIK